MVLKYIAHSCFRLELSNGKHILFDPFAERVGYDMARTGADIVLVSHGHTDHSCTEKVSGSFTLLNEPGGYEIEGIRITGFITFHDKENGSRKGRNIAFKVSAEGLNILHMGDLGHLLEAEQARDFGEVDVLLVPVGGYYTIDASEALAVCDAIGAPVVIPMHYRTPSCKLPIEKVTGFIGAAYLKRECSFLGGCEAEADKLAPGVYVMKNSFGE